MSRYLCLVATVAFVVCTSGVYANQQDRSDRSMRLLREQHQKHLLNLRHELTELSQQCFDKGLKDAAKDITSVGLELTAPSTGFQAPKLVQIPFSPKLLADEKWWRTRLQTIRQDKARELYSLARSALRANLPSLAYAIIQDVLRLNPDHKHSRSVLGQKFFQDPLRKEDSSYAGEWVSPFEASKRSGRKPEVNHPTFGWIPAMHVARYEDGQRLWKNKWVSKQKEAALRSDFQNGWKIQTEHFLIQTNTSLEEGVVLSRQLEIYHDWLRTNLAAFFDTPEALAAKFDQTATRRGPRASKPMDIHYFAGEEEYNRRMRGRIPPNIVTNGLYWEPDRTCYLFRSDKAGHLDTAFHEATHQILDLTTLQHRQAAARKRRLVLRQPSVRNWVLCEKSNFWILEGIACYMESFQIENGVASAGRPDHIRFVGAQQRVLLDGFYVDLRSFSSLGKDTFRQHPNHTQLYTQGSGVAHFLMHYKDGIYRDALIKLLFDVYRPDLKDVTREPSLEKLTGVSFDELDLQYRDHLETLAQGRQRQAAAVPVGN